jgi:cytochrome P450
MNRVGATVASTVDTARVLTRVLGPVIAQGVVNRRPAVTARAERQGWDGRAVRVLDDLRRRYGDGPLVLRLPGRRLALVLTAEDAGRMLAGTPDPFAAATTEKQAALRHFQPDGVLISTGAVRRDRRAFNEAALDTGQAMHRLAGPVTRVVDDEVDRLGDEPDLAWSGYAKVHARVVRRVVLGDPAGDDHHLTDLLDRLRRRANWAYGRPQAPNLRDELHARIDGYLATAAPDCLASVVAATPAAADVHPAGQIPHWLFAYDALGATTFRALAVIATDPSVRSALAGELTPEPAHRPHLAAAILETLRLWPTTLVLLRQTTEPTHWRGRTLPAGTTLIAHSSYLHRDSTRGTAADRFSLQPWLDASADADPGLVPFSAGPARCPGRDLVTFTGATLLAAVLSRYDITLRRPHLDPQRLPMALDHFRIRLELQPRP